MTLQSGVGQKIKLFRLATLNSSLIFIKEIMSFFSSFRSSKLYLLNLSTQPSYIQLISCFYYLIAFKMWFVVHVKQNLCQHFSPQKFYDRQNSKHVKHSNAPGSSEVTGDTYLAEAKQIKIRNILTLTRLINSILYENRF